MASNRTINQALERAAFALGRLRSRVSEHSISGGFAFRQMLTESVATARLEQRSVDHFRILCSIAGIPIRRQRDYGGLSMALESFGAVELAQDKETKLHRAVLGIEDRFDSPSGGSLIELAEIISDTNDNDAIGPAGRIAATRILSRDRYLGGKFISVSEGLKGAPGYRGIPEPSDRIAHVLDRFTRAALLSLEAFEAFECQHQAWHSKIGQVALRRGVMQSSRTKAIRQPSATRRKNSRLPDLVDFMLTANIATSTQAARILGMTRVGAANLMKELEAHDLITQITHRSNLRAYCIRELSVGYNDVISPQKRSRSRVRYTNPEVVIDDMASTIPAPTPISVANLDAQSDHKLVADDAFKPENFDAFLNDVDAILTRTASKSSEKATSK